MSQSKEKVFEIMNCRLSGGSFLFIINPQYRILWVVDLICLVYDYEKHSKSQKSW